MRLFLNPTPIKFIRSLFSSPRNKSPPLGLIRAGSSPSTAIAMATITKSTSLGAVAEEGIARRFWIKFRKESTLALYSPFVVCLASGDLRLDTFRQYVAQDVHFLKTFAQASVFSSPTLSAFFQCTFFNVVVSF
ncbi:hypothetical protein RHMOL_Rhmol05G0228500 [Rhododendron molle]|uniref:Uncharacterized protein n=1 Tax=Rhododendron molle TaxID=49168 RepID=A0ACC0NSA9_RHOML|nr:hypothetical protein RHMOL_Rhmol05G0228500 [Rhododendron molle]